MIPGDLVRSELDNTQLWSTTLPTTKDDICGNMRTSEVALVICLVDEGIGRDWAYVVTSKGQLGWARAMRLKKT